jgi:hypothetical protein
MRPVPARPPGLAAALALCIAVACAPARAEAPISEGAVRALLHAVEAASRERDLAALAALLAPDCRIELRTTVAGREQLTLFTRDEYVALLAQGFAAMKDLERYDYRVSDTTISFDDEPPGATAVSTVHESWVFHGKEVATNSHETARVERRGGRLLLAAVADETEAQ